MKKIRYFPFGYHMADGKITILPKESALLQELFSGYLNGTSLQHLRITQNKPECATAETLCIGTKT